MKNTLLDVTGKLPRGLVELYQLIDIQASKLNIPYLVIGATARDIILHHGFGAAIERGTRDVDFAIQVKNWQEFEQLRNNLLVAGFKQHKTKVHQLFVSTSNDEVWEVDIIPFGSIGGQNSLISWPPEYAISMSVVGFKEAFESAFDVIIDNRSPKLGVKVVSPAGMLLLKLKSWQEREPRFRAKDAMDIYYLVKHYSKIPEVNDLLYQEGYMEVQSYEEFRASAMKLGNDALEIASKETLSLINERVLNNAPNLDKLILDTSREARIDYKDAAVIVDILRDQLLGKQN